MAPEPASMRTRDNNVTAKLKVPPLVAPGMTTPRFTNHGNDAHSWNDVETSIMGSRRTSRRRKNCARGRSSSCGG
eukprot:6686006-Prymnesium_polylepis.1